MSALSREQLCGILEEHAIALKGGMRAQLHPHQSRFLLWAMLREHVPCYGVRGGGNFMEMGCGKTLCMLMLVLFSRLWKKAGSAHDAGRALEWCQRIRQQPCIPCSRVGVQATVPCTLVICSKSAQASWIAEIRQHFGDGPSAPRYVEPDTLRDSLKAVGGGRETLHALLQEYDIVFMTPDTAQQARASAPTKKRQEDNEDEDGDGDEDVDDSSIDAECITSRSILYDVAWERLVVDEAHQFASAKARTVAAIAKIRAQTRWIMTGTQMKNDLGGIVAIYIMMGVKHPLLTSPAAASDSSIAARATAVACAELGAVLTMRRSRGAPDSFVAAQEYDPVTWLKHVWLCYLPEEPSEIVAATVADTRSALSALVHLENLLLLQQAPPRVDGTRCRYFENLWRERLRRLTSSSFGTAALARDYDQVLLDEWRQAPHWAWWEFWERIHRLADGFRRIVAPFCRDGIFDAATLPVAVPYTPPARIVYAMRGVPTQDHRSIEWYLRDALRVVAQEREARRLDEAAVVATGNVKTSQQQQQQQRQQNTLLDASGGSITTYLLLKAASMHPELVRANKVQELLDAVRQFPVVLARHADVLSDYYTRADAAAARTVCDGALSVKCLTAHTRCVSRKMEMFRDYMRYNVRDDEKVVVFDAAVDTLTVFLGYARDALKIPSMLISARTVPQPEFRMAQIRRFSTEPTSVSKILFITTALGAESYNELVRANHCIMLTPWFDTAVEDQAFSRVDRPSQERPVFRIIFDFSDDSIGDDSDRLHLSLSKSHAAAAVCGVPEFSRVIIAYDGDIKAFRDYATRHRHTPAVDHLGGRDDGGRLAQRKRVIEDQFRDTLVVPTHVPFLPGIGHVYLPRVVRSP